MADPKNGFRMEYRGDAVNPYTVIFNNNYVGAIGRNPHSPDLEEWIFTAGWDGKTWSAASLSKCKKVARNALMAWFKKIDK